VLPLGVRDPHGCPGDGLAQVRAEAAANLILFCISCHVMCCAGKWDTGLNSCVEINCQWYTTQSLLLWLGIAVDKLCWVLG
jgi:hypothetical protein